jgi:hypothetical protein
MEWFSTLPEAEQAQRLPKLLPITMTQVAEVLRLWRKRKG